MTRALTLLSLLLITALSPAAEPVAIGSRRELFVDDALVERLSGKAELRLHQPTPQNVALVTDEPWEGNGTNYDSKSGMPTCMPSVFSSVNRSENLMVTHMMIAAGLVSMLGAPSVDGPRLYLPFDGSVEAAVSSGAMSPRGDGSGFEFRIGVRDRCAHIRSDCRFPSADRLSQEQGARASETPRTKAGKLGAMTERSRFRILPFQLARRSQNEKRPRG